MQGLIEAAETSEDKGMVRSRTNEQSMTNAVISYQVLVIDGDEVYCPRARKAVQKVSRPRLGLARRSTTRPAAPHLDELLHL